MRRAPSLRLSLPLLALAFLAGCTAHAPGTASAAAAATPGPPALPAGARWHRGDMFCIALMPDETITREDPGSDFILYHYRRGDQHVVIYEGSYPQPGGIVLQTGVPHPSAISVHGPQALADRIYTGARMFGCSSTMR